MNKKNINKKIFALEGKLTEIKKTKSLRFFCVLFWIKYPIKIQQLDLGLSSTFKKTPDVKELQQEEIL